MAYVYSRACLPCCLMGYTLAVISSLYPEQCGYGFLPTSVFVVVFGLSSYLVFIHSHKRLACYGSVAQNSVLLLLFLSRIWAGHMAFGCFCSLELYFIQLLDYYYYITLNSTTHADDLDIQFSKVK